MPVTFHHTTLEITIVKHKEDHKNHMNFVKTAATMVISDTATVVAPLSECPVVVPLSGCTVVVTPLVCPICAVNDLFLLSSGTPTREYVSTMLYLPLSEKVSTVCDVVHEVNLADDTRGQ